MRRDIHAIMAATAALACAAPIERNNGGPGERTSDTMMRRNAGSQPVPGGGTRERERRLKQMAKAHYPKNGEGA